MDWETWARQAEAALDIRTDGDWKGLFAAGATFADPATPAGTDDLRAVSRDTRAIFPDWHQEITTIRGGERWAVFEWIGRATYLPGSAAPGHDAAIEMHGCSIVEVDETGLVTSWRDYLDRREPERQIRTAVKSQA